MRKTNIRLTVILGILLIILAILIHNTLNRENIINIYLQQIGYENDTYNICDSEQGSYILDNGNNLLGVLVSEGNIWKSYNVLGHERISISNKNSKTYTIKKPYQLEVKGQGVVGKGQYLDSNNIKSWQPICASTCIKSILDAELSLEFHNEKLQNLIDDIHDFESGLSLNEIKHIFDELGYKTEISFNKGDIDKALEHEGYYIIGAFNSDTSSHAVVITSIIKSNHSTYYGVMNPMGINNSRQYTVLDNTLKMCIDTRNYTDGTMYKFSGALIITSKNLEGAQLKLI